FFPVRGIIAAFLVILVFGGALWLAFRQEKVELVDVARILPENTALLLSFRNPLTQWEAIEQSNFYQAVRATPVWRELSSQFQADEEFQALQESFAQLNRNRAILKQMDD